MPIVSEVLDPCDIAYLDSRVDMLQVGARQMTNQALLKHLGAAKKPVLLKRGPYSRLEEMVRAAEFVTVHGNSHIVLCERGIQTFETATRNTLDLAAVPALKTLTHLPVMVDPSHAVGRSDLVPLMALARSLVRADALMIEVHVSPERMTSGPEMHRRPLAPVFSSAWLLMWTGCFANAAGGCRDSAMSLTSFGYDSFQSWTKQILTARPRIRLDRGELDLRPPHHLVSEGVERLRNGHLRYGSAHPALIVDFWRGWCWLPCSLSRRG